MLAEREREREGEREREKEKILRIFCNLYYNLYDLEKLIMQFLLCQIKDILLYNYQLFHY